MTTWQERFVSIASGEKFWTAEYLGHYAAVDRFGQAWRGRIWPENDDDPGYTDYFTKPELAMASLILAIESEVRAQA